MADESYDQSYLEKKYFIDNYRYNCPFCNIRNVEYSVEMSGVFHWSPQRLCYYHIVECSRCKGKSLHLTYYNLYKSYGHFAYPPKHEITKDEKTYWMPIVTKDGKEIKELDNIFFYHHPTSFFTIDSRIPEIIRELITEAEGCLKMNYLTGASACMRKAIYELTIIEKCASEYYEDRIKELKKKHPAVDESLIDVLAHIQEMTSDKIHEQSWDKWDSGNLKLIIETLKSVLYEIYVEPANKKSRVSAVAKLLESVKRPKKKEEFPQPEDKEAV